MMVSAAWSINEADARESRFVSITEPCLRTTHPHRGHYPPASDRPNVPSTASGGLWPEPHTPRLRHRPQGVECENRRDHVVIAVEGRFGRRGPTSKVRSASGPRDTTKQRKPMRSDAMPCEV
jgi:hypothetical protein